jgi:predicted secreted protein
MKINTALPSARHAAFCFALALAPLAPAAAFAQTTPLHDAPSGELTQSAQASAEVPEDVVHITLFFEQEAADPASLTATLKQKAEQALRESRGQSAVTVRTGAFSIYPSTDKNGKIAAWRGRTELVLESRDFGAASTLAGRMSASMQISDVSFSLSTQARLAAEQRLTDEAIEAFRQQAQSAAKSFGYAGYTIRRVQIGKGGGTSPRPMMMMARSSMSVKAAAPVPLEAGQTTVTVTVNGSVQMTR